MCQSLIYIYVNRLLTKVKVVKYNLLVDEHASHMSDDPLRSEIARKFAQAISSLRISKARAARDLQVSRQMLYAYLDGKSLPKHEVLQRACSAWNLELSYNNLIISARSFPSAQGQAKTLEGEQLKLDLQEAIEQLRDEDLGDFGIQILDKANGRVELRIDVRFGKAS